MKTSVRDIAFSCLAVLAVMLLCIGALGLAGLSLFLL